MLGRIALFELRYQLRRPIALISFLVFAALAFGLESIATFGGGIANAPRVIAVFLGLFSILAMFLSIAVLADVALRDIETRMDAIMRTQPVHSATYFGGRFAGAYAVACLAFLGTAIGIGVAVHMPWVPADSVGPFRLTPYALAMLMFALPNLFITGALFFTVASLTRSLLATYLSALVFFIVYASSQVLLSSPESRAIAAFARCSSHLQSRAALSSGLSPDRQPAPGGRLVVASRAEPRNRPSAKGQRCLSPAGAAPAGSGCLPCRHQGEG